MSNRWMIRTKEFSLKGPVSSDVIVSMMGSGKLGEEDEVCQGSGYWFYLSEEILVDKYLKGGLKQPFNPVNAVPSPVFTEQSSSSILEDNPIAGSDTESQNDSNTQILDLNNLDLSAADGPKLSSVEKPIPLAVDKFLDKMPSGEDLEYPEEGELLSSTKPPVDRRQEKKGSDRRQPKKGADRRKQSVEVAVDRRGGDRRKGRRRRKASKVSLLLKLLVLLLVSAVLALIYYYVLVLGQPLPFSRFISSVHAQSIELPVKKKELG
jgi:hypothetical protein